VRKFQAQGTLSKRIVHPCVYLIIVLLYGWCEFDLEGRAMHTTKISKNCNSQAVRIPSDLAYERTEFARFSPEFFAEARGDHEQAERDAL